VHQGRNILVVIPVRGGVCTTARSCTRRESEKGGINKLLYRKNHNLLAFSEENTCRIVVSFCGNSSLPSCKLIHSLHFTFNTQKRKSATENYRKFPHSLPTITSRAKKKKEKRGTLFPTSTEKMTARPEIQKLGRRKDQGIGEMQALLREKKRGAWPEKKNAK